MELFGLRKHGTTVSSEIIGGVVNFFTMFYILMLNPLILSAAGMPTDGVFAATALSAAFCTFGLALFANSPCVAAPGMGMNTVFAVTICTALGFDWREALAVTFIAGILHIITMLTPARVFLIKSIPTELKIGVTAALGIFIANLGILNTGLFDGDTSISAAHSLSEFTANIVSADTLQEYVIAAGLIVIIALCAVEYKMKMSYAYIPVGIVITFFLSIPLSLSQSTLTDLPSIIDLSAIKAVDKVWFSFFGDPGIISLVSDPSKFATAMIMVLIIYTAGVYDIVGTIYGLNSVVPKNAIYVDKETYSEFEISLSEDSIIPTKTDSSVATDIDAPQAPVREVDEEAVYILDGVLFSGEETDTRNINSGASRVLVANSFGGVISALFGSSSSTVYCESAGGIVSGARTGLTSLVTAILFLCAIPFYGLFRILPSEAAAPALVIVGMSITLNAFSLKPNWNKFEVGLPTLFIILTMLALSSIGEAVIIGISVYTLIVFASGDKKKIRPSYIVAVIILLLMSMMKSGLGIS